MILMRNRFDTQLEHLNESMKEMGILCEDSIGNAIDSLMDGNVKKAQKVLQKRKRN